MQSGYIISCANIAVIEGFTQQREVAIQASVMDIGVINSKYTGVPVQMQVFVLVFIFRR